MTALLVVLVVLVLLGVSLAGSSVRVLREYERGVVFRLGRLVAQTGPGLVLLVPIADRMVRVTLRTITHTIPPQDVITRDNVPARVDAVAYFRVVDADASVVDIENYLQATAGVGAAPSIPRLILFGAARLQGAGPPYVRPRRPGVGTGHQRPVLRVVEPGRDLGRLPREAARTGDRPRPRLAYVPRSRLLHPEAEVSRRTSGTASTPCSATTPSRRRSARDSRRRG
jgi:SPFH domain/Band 7 family protein